MKELFNQIDKKLKAQEWDEIAPIIESIFKSKWGKVIKVDDSPKKKLDLHGNPIRADYGFRKAIASGENLLLGYNIKNKASCHPKTQKTLKNLKKLLKND